MERHVYQLCKHDIITVGRKHPSCLPHFFHPRSFPAAEFSAGVGPARAAAATFALT